MPAYDASNFDPPAPLARVSLRNPGSGKTISNIPMLIDSGADMTLIPQATVNELNLTLDPGKTYKLESFDGSSSEAEAVQADLLFLGRIIRGRYLVLDSRIGILGRDVLNHFSIVLNGPDLRWQ